MGSAAEPVVCDAPLMRKVLSWIALGSLVLAIFFFFWRGPMPLEGIVHSFAEKALWKAGLVFADNPATLRHYYALDLALVLFILSLACGAELLWVRLSEARRSNIYAGVFTLTLSAVMAYLILQLTYEGPWVPLDVLMSHPAQVPLYAHRLLFVWIAKGLEHLIPHLSNLRAFYISQWIASVLALSAVRRWSAVFVGRSFSWAGQTVALLLMALCLDYYTFYDIGTVFFTSCALIAIYTKRYWWLVPIVLIGTLNYDGTLLLMPLAAFVAYKEPWKTWLPPVAVAFVFYCVDRLLLQRAVPVQMQFEWQVWANMMLPWAFHKFFAHAVVKTFGWLVIALLCFPYCGPRLKRMTLLFPLNLLTSFFFGKMNEVRLFEACIPVLVAMILAASVRRLSADLKAGLTLGEAVE